MRFYLFFNEKKAIECRYPCPGVERFCAGDSTIFGKNSRARAFCERKIHSESNPAIKSRKKRKGGMRFYFFERRDPSVKTRYYVSTKAVNFVAAPFFYLLNPKICQYPLLCEQRVATPPPAWGVFPLGRIGPRQHSPGFKTATFDRKCVACITFYFTGWGKFCSLTWQVGTHSLEA